MVNVQGIPLYGWADPPIDHNKDPNSAEYKISIVIPTLNQGDTLEDTLKSIIYQDDKNYEIIVIDGGSIDNTDAVITKYRDYIAHYSSRKDKGQSAAINNGFSLASGNIYAWINSDDFYLPNAFSVVRQTFARNKNIDIVVGSGDVLTKDCQFLKHMKGFRMDRERLLGWNNDQWIMQQCCFWKAEIWEKSGGVDETLHLLMDYDLWLRFATLGTSIAIGDRLAIMRYYKQAKTLALRGKTKEEEAYVYAKNEAYQELRKLVSELSSDNERLNAIIDKNQKHLSSRVLRKLGVLR